MKSRKKSARRKRRSFVKHLRMKPRKRSRRETLTRNPTRTYLIEVCVAKSLRSIKYMWWNDSEQKFTDKKAQASPYKSEHAARIEAKKLLPRLPAIVRTLRTIPA